MHHVWHQKRPPIRRQSVLEGPSELCRPIWLLPKCPLPSYLSSRLHHLHLLETDSLSSRGCSVVLPTPPNIADPLPCPPGADGVVDMGPWPLRLAPPPRLGPSQDRRSLAPPSASGPLAGHAKAPLCADIQAVLKVTLCDMSPGANKCMLCPSHQSWFLSASVIADCI